MQEAARLLVDSPQTYAVNKAITLAQGVELTPVHIAVVQHNAAAEEALISAGTQQLVPGWQFGGGVGSACPAQCSSSRRCAHQRRYAAAGARLAVGAPGEGCQLVQHKQQQKYQLISAGALVCARLAVFVCVRFGGGGQLAQRKAAAKEALLSTGAHMGQGSAMTCVDGWAGVGWPNILGTKGSSH
jgi:hypothetical protein